MPKISYIDKINNGKDTAQVTVAQVEQKIADIEALLRGMIDVENVLSSDDSSDTVPLSPSNVVDMPVETRPVQHCMKLFGNEQGESSIKEKLFDELTLYSEKALDLRLVGGISDQEIFFELTADDTTESGYERKTVTLEIPYFWSPVTAEELWNAITEGGVLEVDILDYDINLNTSAGVYVKPFLLNDVDVFATKVLGCRDKSDFVYEAGYNILAGSNRIETDSPTYRLRDNSIEYSCEFRVWGEGVYGARYYVSVLCKVNP